MAIKPDGMKHLGTILDIVQKHNFKICRIKMVVINETCLKNMQRVQEIENPESFMGVNVVLEVLRDKAVEALLSLSGKPSKVQLGKTFSEVLNLSSSPVFAANSVEGGSKVFSYVLP